MRHIHNKSPIARQQKSRGQKAIHPHFPVANTPTPAEKLSRSQLEADNYLLSAANAILQKRIAELEGASNDD